MLKISGNRNTVVKLSDFIDMDVAGIILGSETLEQAGDRILEESLRVAAGQRTKAEAIGYWGSTAIYHTGPIV